MRSDKESALESNLQDGEGNFYSNKQCKSCITNLFKDTAEMVDLLILNKLENQNEELNSKLEENYMKMIFLPEGIYKRKCLIFSKHFKKQNQNKSNNALKENNYEIAEDIQKEETDQENEIQKYSLYCKGCNCIVGFMTKENILSDHKNSSCTVHYVRKDLYRNAIQKNKNENALIEELFKLKLISKYSSKPQHKINQKEPKLFMNLQNKVDSKKNLKFRNENANNLNKFNNPRKEEFDEDSFNPENLQALKINDDCNNYHYNDKDNDNESGKSIKANENDNENEYEIESELEEIKNTYVNLRRKKNKLVKKCQTKIRNLDEILSGISLWIEEAKLRILNVNDKFLIVDSLTKL